VPAAVLRAAVLRPEARDGREEEPLFAGDREERADEPLFLAVERADEPLLAVERADEPLPLAVERVDLPLPFADELLAEEREGALLLCEREDALRDDDEARPPVERLADEPPEPDPERPDDDDDFFGCGMTSSLDRCRRDPSTPRRAIPTGPSARAGGSPPDPRCAGAGRRGPPP
jgi:hypothetical protein